MILKRIIASLGLISLALSLPDTLTAKEPYLGDNAIPRVAWDALHRFTDPNHKYANIAKLERDRAILFMHNDAINAARINNKISNTLYQKAQEDFVAINERLGRKAATAAGADFTVQVPSGGAKTTPRYSPGTDSDYITIVTSKQQIINMQGHYNNNVNAFLQERLTDGDLETMNAKRSNWQERLDVDFMGDPRGPPDANGKYTRPLTEKEFAEIATYQNDAYKRRASAEYERISRATDGGKIGPEHVKAYTADMGEFTAKKQAKISKLLKDSSNFSDPMKRAETIRMMAQEQKYISRIESLDAFLRKQEGLKPRNRGITIAKQGSVRDPSNVKNTKSAHRVAKTSQGNAVADLIETLSEVAEKNDAFKATVADDIAEILAQAPAQYRGASMARLRNASPDLMKAVAASKKFSAIDDLASAGRVLRTGGKLADSAKSAGRMMDAAKSIMASKVLLTSKALSKAISGLDKLGTAADVVETALVLKKFKSIYDARAKMLDPRTTDIEAKKISKQIDALRKEIIGDSSMFVAIEGAALKYPNIHIPIAYLTWAAYCFHKDWSRTKAGNCTQDNYDAAIDAWDSLFGDKLVRDATRAKEAETQCNKFLQAVEEGRTRAAWPYSVEDVCDALKNGWPTEDMRDDDGTKLAEHCKSLMRHVGTARATLKSGKLNDANYSLGRAKYWLSEYRQGMCPTAEQDVVDLQSELNAAISDQLNKFDTAVADCRFEDATQHRVGLLFHNEHERLMSSWLEKRGADQTAKELLEAAKEDRKANDIERAKQKIKNARGFNPCPDTSDKLTDLETDLRKQQEKSSRIASASAKEKKAGARPECKPSPVSSEPQKYTYRVCIKQGESCWTQHCVTPQEMIRIIQKQTKRYHGIKTTQQTPCNLPKPANDNPACVTKSAKKKKNLDNCDRDPTVPDSMKDENGCVAFGEAKKSSGDQLASAKKDTRPKKSSAHCTALNTRVSDAVGEFKKGKVKASLASMEAVLSEISGNAKSGTCEKVRGRAQRNADRLKKIKKAIAGVKTALQKCDPKGIKKFEKRLAGVDNPRLKALHNRLVRAQPVAAKYQVAKRAYWQGDMARAQSLFRDTLRQSEASSGRTCVNMQARVAKNISRIGKLQRFGDKSKAAIQSCDMTQIASLKDAIKNVQNRYLSDIYNQLKSVPSNCQEQKDTEFCRSTFGEHSIAKTLAERKTGEATCKCKAGHQWWTNDGSEKQTCIPTSVAKKRQQNNMDKWCIEKNGPGHYAREYGEGFNCLPTKATADAWCRNKYGSGHYASSIGPKGGHSCLPTKATANAWCNRNNKGSGWYAGKIRSGGSYNCYRKNRAATPRRKYKKKYRQKRRYTPPRRQQRKWRPPNLGTDPINKV